MKYKVQLFIAGRVLDFTCYAQSPSGANEVAKAQYPNATIIHTTAVFRWFTPLRMTYKGDENSLVYVYIPIN